MIQIQMTWLIIVCLAKMAASHIIEHNDSEYNDTQTEDYENMFEDHRDDFLHRKSTMEQVEKDFREAQAAYQAAVNVELEQQMKDNNMDTINHCLWYQVCNTSFYILLFVCFALFVCCCMAAGAAFLFFRNGRKERVYAVQTQQKEPHDKTPAAAPPVQKSSIFPTNYGYSMETPIAQDTSCIDNMSNSTLLGAGVAIIGVVILIFIFTL